MSTNGTRCGQILERFKQWHRENPEVWKIFRRFALQAAAARPHYSSRALIYRIRWETAIETRGDEVKINNDFSPYYCRMFEILYPEHEGFFEKRRLRSADSPAWEQDQSVFVFGPGEETWLRQSLVELLAETEE